MPFGFVVNKGSNPDPHLFALDELDRLLVDHCRALSSPLLFGHRLIADDVPAEHVLELLAVSADARDICSSPEDARRDIGRHVLDVRHSVSCASLSQNPRRESAEPNLTTTGENHVPNCIDLVASQSPRRVR